MSGALGRLVPPSDKHIRSYPYSAVAPAVPLVVNKVLKLPSWHWTHDQGAEGSCVGHGSAMERAITNTAQNFLAKLVQPTVRYDPIDIWNEAKLADGDPSTNPGDDNGTFVHAAYDVLRTEGPRRVSSMKLVKNVPTPVGEQIRSAADGVATTRWATTVDEVRTALSEGLPVTVGINWYENFDTPIAFNGENWIGKGDLGNVRGGHCVCLYGASDKRNAVRIKNSWGRAYPLVWLPYLTLERLLKEDGEAALITDK